MGLKLFGRRKETPGREAARAQPAPVKRSSPRVIVPEKFEPAELTELQGDPLRRQMQLQRFGAIVLNRQQWRSHPDIEAVHAEAMDEIDRRFALVPEGFVSLPQTINDEPGCPEVDIDTEAFLLCRCPVTNEQFQLFVDAGCYGELELWPRDIWPHLIDFKDQTGEPGPRFWRSGRHNRRLTSHPVVGICYYEALAYAQWAGYRLPTEAEWQMAASWRIRSSAHVLRRYPWGDALDTNRCNIWASGVGETVPVDAYESGAAPNGVLQLVGNVWEWTASDLEITDAEGHPLMGDMLLKSIRGGAFDTYFPGQATSCFRTGLASLARTHNVGFRCVMDLDSAV